MYNIHKQTGNSHSLTHTCHTQTGHRKCPCASSTSWRISFMYCSMALHWWCVSQEPKCLWTGFYYVQMSTHHHHHHHQSILLMLVQSPVSPERPAWSSCLSGLRQWSSTLLVRVLNILCKTLMFTNAVFNWPKIQHTLWRCEIFLLFKISFLSEISFNILF